MKKVFWTGLIGGILGATLSAGALGQPTASPADDINQKQRVKIIVVEKTKQPGGSNQSQKPRPENRNKRP